MRSSSALVARLVIGVGLLAMAGRTQDAAAVATKEQQFLVKAVAGLHTFADACTAQKQHGRALALRREILTEYAPEDEAALGKCGFSKVGAAWRADPEKLVLETDFKVEPKVTKKLDQDWAALQKDLLAGHRAVAEDWTRLGDEARALRHWKRVQRFAPGDRRAAEALASRRFEGFSGTELELGMLRRARTIRGACDWLLRRQFLVKLITDRKHPLLEKAGFEHHGCRSEHFEVWGILPEAQLQLAAASAERALLLCRTLFGTAEGEPFRPHRLRNILLCADDASYGKLIDLCADQFDAERLAFLKKDVDLAFLKVGEQDVRLYKTNGGDEELLDQSVRGVVQDAVGIYQDGLWEGLGHAGCGFLFGRTLTFLLELQTAKTVASSTSTLLVPDMEVWKKIAEQSAWARSDTRTSELVLLSAYKFTTEQRVKAWAICDYLMHWRPELLRELAASQTKDIHTPPDIENEFQRRTGLALPAIDQAWREFWGQQVNLRKAMAVDPLGDPKGKERKLREASRAIVDAVDEWRAQALRGPVGFHFGEDPGTVGALAWQDEVVRVELELKKLAAQKVKPPKVPVPPPPPATIGRTVLFASGSDPVAAVAGWMARPAWRDTLLHPGRGLLGARQGSHGLAIDLTDPVQPTTKGLPLTWPRQRQVDVPGSADAAALGPRVQAALAAAGKPTSGPVGMPLSMHFARELPADQLATIDAVVWVGGIRRPGVLVRCQGEGPDDDTAPGCVAFVPFEPLPAGGEGEVEWTVPAVLLAKGERFPTVRFLVKP